MIGLFTNEIDKNDIPVKITENVDYSYMGPVVGCPMPAYRRADLACTAEIASGRSSSGQSG